jgi:ATP-binding protein involved in chromosome partitioning
MTTPFTDLIHGALGTVRDPALHEDLVSLGMIGNVSVQDDAVRVRILLVTEAYPHRQAIEDGVRTAVSPRVDGRRVEVEFSAILGGTEQAAVPGVRNIIAVGSGKGGVGKSTMAANIAASLMLEGASVGILDADIYGPSQAKMFGVEGKRLMADTEKRMLPLVSSGIRIISIANLVEAGQALTWRGPILHGTLTQMLKQTLWGELDVLIVDMPPGTGDVQLSLSQLVTVTGGVLVTTPQDMALIDVHRAYTMLRKTHIPVLGIIENMSYYQLPDGTRDPIFGEGGARAFAEEERVPLLGQIAIQTALREAADAGLPLVISEPESVPSQQLRRAVRALAREIGSQAMVSLPVV